MRTKIAYAVFTLIDSGKDYIVKGNFGNDKQSAEKWAENHANDTELIGASATRNGDMCQ
jgi:hypothetical protein